MPNTNALTMPNKNLGENFANEIAYQFNLCNDSIQILARLMNDAIQAACKNDKMLTKKGRAVIKGNKAYQENKEEQRKNKSLTYIMSNEDMPLSYKIYVLENKLRYLERRLADGLKANVYNATTAEHVRTIRNLLNELEYKKKQSA